MIIDLRSDTVTKPSAEMLLAMSKAEVGDDVFAEDPTVIRLQEYAANLFGKEAALFCPSGTMCNQIAIKCHTHPMEEVICDKLSHIYNYENGGYAFNAGVSIRLIEGENGIIASDQIPPLIQPDHDWLPKTTLVVIENTCNKGGGSFYSLSQVEAISKTCKENSLSLHLDGARIFNALAEMGNGPKEIGALVDSISVCLSKGLGAPIGSVLLGTKEFIKKARKWRKAMGGGMRQVGVIAAAGMHALEKNRDRIKDDHRRASELGTCLANRSWVKQVLPVKSNIVIFELDQQYDGAAFVADLEKEDIKAIQFGPQWVRFVTHLDITQEMVSRTIDVINGLNPK